MKLRCRVFGHRSGFILDPFLPYDIFWGCIRCKDSSLMISICHGTPDPMHPGTVKVTGLDRLRGLLEGVQTG